MNYDIWLAVSIKSFDCMHLNQIIILTQRDINIMIPLQTKLFHDTRPQKTRPTCYYNTLIHKVLHVIIHFSAVIFVNQDVFPITLHGVPYALLPAGISSSTKLLAPIMQPLPIVTPFTMIVLGPMKQLSPMFVFAYSYPAFPSLTAHLTES